MIRREKVHALILGRRKSGEADRILTLFTREHGLLRVTAKGVRKIPSRRGGHIEPLTHVMAIISGNHGHYYLAAVETVNEYRPLRDQAATTDQAHNMAHVIPHLFEEELAQPMLFDALHHAWEVLPELPSAKRHLLESAILLLMLREAGVLPQLKNCLQCKREQPHDAVVLDSGEGGWRCLTCHSSFSGTRLSLAPRLLKTVRFISRYPERALNIACAESEAAQTVDAIRHYVSGVIGKPLLSESVSPFVMSYAR